MVYVKTSRNPRTKQMIPQSTIQKTTNHHRIQVKYLTEKKTRNTFKTCHRCGHVARKVNGRIYKCPKCGMKYDRDLNACINIAHRVMSSMGAVNPQTPRGG